MRKLKSTVLIPSMILATSAAFAAEQRGYVAGQQVLSIGGTQVGSVKRVSGGDISAPVVDEPVGTSKFPKRHIGPIRYEEFVIQLGLDLSDPMADLIAGTWTGDAKRVDGAITEADYDLNARSERRFKNALLTETTFPAMGAMDKDPGFITLKLAPETIQRVKASGKVTLDAARSRAKGWIPANFKLEIDGLDCTRVARIDSFSVKRAAAPDNVGEARDSKKEPARLEFPILKITVAESSAETWISWFDEFVVKGNCDDSKEKSGTLTLLGANMKDPVARIKLQHLGICRLHQEDAEAGSDRLATLVAEVYVEGMEFQAGKSLGTEAPAAATPPQQPPADPNLRRRPGFPGLPPPPKK